MEEEEEEEEDEEEPEEEEQEEGEQEKEEEEKEETAEAFFTFIMPLYVCTFRCPSVCIPVWLGDGHTIPGMTCSLEANKSY